MRGNAFDYWPSEIVLGYSDNNVINAAEISQDVMRLVARTNTELTFEVTTEYTFVSAHTWSVFGSPNTPPRTILAYTT